MPLLETFHYGMRFGCNKTLSCVWTQGCSYRGTTPMTGVAVEEVIWIMR